jgi:hypothetical protein
MNLEIHSADITYNMLENTVRATVLHSLWEAKVNETWFAYIPTLPKTERITIQASLILRGLKLSRECLWGFKCFEVWCCVMGWALRGISKAPCSSETSGITLPTTRGHIPKKTWALNFVLFFCCETQTTKHLLLPCKCGRLGLSV